MTTKMEHLKRGIVGLSQSKDWERAKIEWVVDHISEDREGSVCLCTHSPIVELCHLYNTENGNSTVVGNCCALKFMGINTAQVFLGVKKIRKSLELALNEECIYYFHRRYILGDWERDFYLNTWRKRALTGKQLAMRVNLNRKILDYHDQKTK